MLAAILSPPYDSGKSQPFIRRTLIDPKERVRAMSKQRSVKTYRVVGINNNGRRDHVDANLSKLRAEEVRASVLATFSEVLIQEERRPGRGPSQTGDSLPFPE